MAKRGYANLELFVTVADFGTKILADAAITAFTVPALIGNGNYNLYGNEIEMAFKQAAGSAGSADYSVGSTLAIILLICVFISTAVMNRFDKDHEEGGNLL